MQCGAGRGDAVRDAGTQCGTQGCSAGRGDAVQCHRLGFRRGFRVVSPPLSFFRPQSHLRRCRFGLCGVFYSATMVPAGPELLRFELSLGNYGDSSDATCKPAASVTPDACPVFDGEWGAGGGGDRRVWCARGCSVCSGCREPLPLPALVRGQAGGSCHLLLGGCQSQVGCFKPPACPVPAAGEHPWVALGVGVGEGRDESLPGCKT